MIDEEIIDTAEETVTAAAEIDTATSTESDIPEETHEESHDVPKADYADIAACDLRELKEQFPELASIEDIIEIENPIRYAALRDLGLTPREAYLATNGRSGRTDNRSHLSFGIPRGAGAPRGSMSRDELYRAREIFDGMSDSEIQSLYKRVKT